MSGPNHRTGTNEYDGRKNLRELLERIEQWQTDTLRDIQGYSLADLLSLRDALRKLGNNLKPIESEDGTKQEDFDVLRILGQISIKIILLESRNRVFEALERRISYLRNRSGTPTLQRIRERYEDTNYEPPNFPNWSEKQWRSIYHQHRKAMRDLEHKKRVDAWKQERKEEEEAIKKELALGVFLSVLDQRRDQVQEQQEKMRERIASILSQKTQDEASENEAVLGFYYYANAFLDHELYFALDYNLQRKSEESGKKNKKFYTQVITLLREELTRRGLPHTTREQIRKGHRDMTESERSSFIEQEL